MSFENTVKDAFLDTVSGQVETGNPPEAKAAYDRLIAGGQTHSHALHQLAGALRTEMDRMLTESTPFDERRYTALLEAITGAE